MACRKYCPEKKRCLRNGKSKYLIRNGVPIDLDQDLGVGYIPSYSTASCNFDNCCLTPACQTLHVILLCLQPWTAIPGAFRNEESVAVNQPPAMGQFPISPGLPFNMRISATPATLPKPLLYWNPTERRTGYNRKYGVPNALYERYGDETLATAKILSMKFGRRGEKKGEGFGQLNAYGIGGRAQASLDFTYRWCGPHVCKDTLLPVFEVTDCTQLNSKFVLLGQPDEFVPFDYDASLCSDAFVVMGLQQWCCAEYPDQVTGQNQILEPTGCLTRPLNCQLQHVFKTCDPASAPLS